jgi:hypothetical protein
VVGFDRGESLAQRFRAHAGDQTHLYGYALRALADDLDAGGPTREVVRGYEDAPVGAVIQLRLLAGIFRIVLTGRAPELEPYYPCLGGTESPVQVWQVLRRVVAEHRTELHQALAIAPQTNEVGRSVALLVGLYDLAQATGRRRIRLLELGASAGLNLLLGWFRVTGGGWAWGALDSPVRLLDAIRGDITAAPLEIVLARGCDLDPVDATSEEGRLRLTSFVWPFDLHRHDRLAGALQLAAAHPPQVDRASAADWLAVQLSEPGEADTLTVVWHSVTQLYWPAAEIEAVDATLAAYGLFDRVAEVGMEYDPDGAPGEKPRIWTNLWLGGGAPVRHRLLGTTHDHGIPVWLTR